MIDKTTIDSFEEDIEVVKEVSLNALIEAEENGCPICGSFSTWKNSRGEMVCDGCGFDENY